MPYSTMDILALVGILLSFLWMMRSCYTYINTYQKYKKVESKKEYSGCEVARTLLDQNGLKDVYVVTVKGFLKDHYDPRRKVIRLSKETFDGTGLAMIGIAARECAHAIQDKNHNTLLKVRGMLKPALEGILVLGYLGILISLFSFSRYYLVLSLGILVFVFLFHLLTFPLEKEATSIALKEIEKANLITKKEKEQMLEILEAGKYLFMASPILFIIQLGKSIFS